MDDINFQLRRCTNGWSEAKLYINGDYHQFFLTHIFNDPLQAICTATVLLAKGTNEVCFSWYDEPGQYDWKITQAKSKADLLDVSIYEYENMMGCDRQQDFTNKLMSEINFRVKRDFWLTLVALEIEKIARLLTYPHYKRDRNPHTFPWQDFKELKQYLK